MFYTRYFIVHQIIIQIKVIFTEHLSIIVVILTIQQSLFPKTISLTHFNEIFVRTYKHTYKYTWKNTHTNIQPSKFAMITTLYLNCIIIYCNYLPLIYIITLIYYYDHLHTCISMCI